MKRIVYTVAIVTGLLSLLSGCSKRLENKLLEPKGFFDQTYVPIEVRGESAITYPLKARISSPIDKNVGVSYTLGNASDVEEYNKRNGTEYLLFPLENATIKEAKSNITAGSIFATPTDVVLTNLEAVEEGKTFLLPIRFVPSDNIGLISSAETMFLALQKPVQIKSVASFSDDWISVPRMTDETFQSVTYEALIYPTYWNDNNTVMGLEGKLILRIGDEGGGLARNKIQIAGNKQFHYDTGLDARKWYHVAFTFNHNTGKAVMYINGKPVASGDWDQIADIREGFAIGQVPHFMWGVRPFNGYMSEVRLWNVARTENEIKQNMLKVDPKANGLIFYYRLNGTDVKDVNGEWTVIDATGHGYNGEPNDGNRELSTKELPTPLEVKDLM